MTKLCSLLLLACFFLSCNNDDSQPINKNKKEIKVLSIENTVDSVFYDKEKLTHIKESVVGREYLNINYEYNEKGLLSKISTTNSIIDNYVEYQYNSNGSLKSRKFYRTGFAGGAQIINHYFSYQGNKIIIEDDDIYKKTHKKVITLDSKNRIKSIEKQKETLDGYFTSCEYTYDSKGNVSTAIKKNTENFEPVIFAFDYDNKNNPFKSLDSDLPNGLSIKKLESVIYDLNIAFSGLDYANAYDYLHFQNTNNVTQLKRNDYKVLFNYQYNNENYPTQVDFPHLSVNYALKIKY